jgi:aminopeptidase N
MTAINMLNPASTTVYLKDYASPAFLIRSIDLDVDLQDDHARVRARLTVERNPDVPDRSAPLVLDGEDLQLESISLDGRALGRDEYTLTAEQLTLPQVPGRLLHPMRGEGFRRITFFPTVPT